MAQIVLDNVSKVYGGNVSAIDALSLDIADVGHHDQGAMTMPRPSSVRPEGSTCG